MFLALPDALLVPGELLIETVGDRSSGDARFGWDHERGADRGGMDPDVVDLHQPSRTFRGLGRRLAHPGLLPSARWELGYCRATAESWRSTPQLGHKAPCGRVQSHPASNRAAPSLGDTDAAPGCGVSPMSQVMPGNIRQVAILVHEYPQAPAPATRHRTYGALPSCSCGSSAIPSYAA